ncbi:putative phage tail protein [Paenibacillus sp. 481]|uniref:putative phage tail protein n=1 Tax=Paenibacillus sp. 481 TaxID=2835869 RepID=UPI001E5D0A01|nr:putative phage tail protein [Paenibacillus sp. 481]UHA72303.1 DUF2313 domain-containing protein [Paenibacillus sp. 481]
MPRNHVSYLPPYYEAVREFQALGITVDAESQRLGVALEQWLADQFVLTASEYAVKRREQQLGIQADPAVEMLDFRKKRVMNRYATKPPFTARYLQQRLDFLLGAGRARVEVDGDRFLLKVIAKIGDAAIFKEVEHTVRGIKPANLVYNQATSLADRIVVQERITRTPLTRMTLLSTTWKLGSTPFAKRNQEVVVL